MERAGFGDARRLGAAAAHRLGGPDGLTWHLRIAAVGSAALVLANIAFAPARLWSLNVMAAWTALLAANAVLVVRRRDRAAAVSVPGVAVADHPAHPRAVGPTPLFTDDSPTVERPRSRPPVAAEPAADRPPAAGEPAPRIAGPDPADGAVAARAVAAPHPAAPPMADVAVSVVVLPAAGAHSSPVNVAVRSAEPAATAAVLPDRIVALWGGGRPSGPTAAWGTAPASVPVPPDLVAADSASAP